MFLHIGDNHMVDSREVVLIGDIESSGSSEITEEFLHISGEEGFIVDYSNGNARSFILTGETIYFSMISSATLAKRMRNLIN
ncbi:MAG: extracellular matrix regulator RemB [Halanaerobiales bacterium]